MQKIKCLLTTLVLLLCVSMTAMAGETQGPPAPGEMNSPPGETSSPPDPGDGHSPGLMSILLTYWLGLD